MNWNFILLCCFNYYSFHSNFFFYKHTFITLLIPVHIITLLSHYTSHTVLNHFNRIHIFVKIIVQCMILLMTVLLFYFAHFEWYIFTFLFLFFRHWRFIFIFIICSFHRLFYCVILFSFYLFFPARTEDKLKILMNRKKKAWWLVKVGLRKFYTQITPPTPLWKGGAGIRCVGSWRCRRCWRCQSSRYPACKCEEQLSDSHPGRPDDHSSPARERHVIVVL